MFNPFKYLITENEGTRLNAFHTYFQILKNQDLNTEVSHIQNQWEGLQN